MHDKLDGANKSSEGHGVQEQFKDFKERYLKVVVGVNVYGETVNELNGVLMDFLCEVNSLTEWMTPTLNVLRSLPKHDKETLSVKERYIFV